MKSNGNKRSGNESCRRKEARKDMGKIEGGGALGIQRLM
jgi:hypothetical protein